MPTLGWIELALDIVQHVADVDLSRVVPHHGLVGDRRIRHISLFEVIHEAFRVVESDVLDTASWQIKLRKYVAGSIQ